MRLWKSGNLLQLIRINKDERLSVSQYLDNLNEAFKNVKRTREQVELMICQSKK